jgi:hypothetical protein
MEKFKIKKVLSKLKGKKVISITKVNGPIPCYSLEFDDCYIDIASSAHQVVPKTKEVVDARNKQLNES